MFLNKVDKLAQYLSKLYKDKYHKEISEMQLHKLLYFIQRESYVQRNEPMFNNQFHGWKYGPVLPEIRAGYKYRLYDIQCDDVLSEEDKNIVNQVFCEFAPKDPWTLSRLTHGESSWINSRRGVPVGANGDNLMKNEDIQKDAERIKERRQQLSLFIKGLV